MTTPTMTIEEAMERVLHMQQRLERQYSLADATSLRLILDEVERLRALEYHTALADRVEDVMGGRSAAEARAKRLEDAQADSTGWLVERNDLGSPRWLCFGPRHRDTTYTTDANKALRFMRKEDAEAAMYHLENNDPVLRVTEHKWIARAALSEETT